MGWFRWPKAKIRSRDIKYASSSRYLTPLEDMPADPAKMKEWAKRRILKRGWKFKVRDGITAAQRRFTMTLRRIVYLVSGWKSYSVAKQAQILVHEDTHCWQRRWLSHVRFETRYLHAVGRWRLEMPAYRMTIRAKIRQGYSKKQIERYIEYKLSSFYDGYKLGRIPYGSFAHHTRSIWKLELDAYD